MTLLSTIQLAKNSLFTSQLGIQVASQNIANADTPGYVRERLNLATGPSQRIGKLTIGSGVLTTGVVREVDQFLQQRMWSASSDLGNGQVQRQTYAQLEAVIGEFSDVDLSSSLAQFFNSINDVLNQPEDPSVRNLAITRGQALAEQINHLNDRVRDLRETTNDRIRDAASEINRLVNEVSKLNVQIMEVEMGGASGSDAVGLRDKRDAALAQLARIIDIKVDEQPTGAVNVFVGGDYLVFDGAVQTVKIETQGDRGLAAVELRLANTEAPVPASSGELAGLVASRDQILGGFLDELDSFVGSMIHGFNRIHASGQGQIGHQDIQGQYAVADPSAALDEAGLSFAPEHGSFVVEIYNPDTGLRRRHDVHVKLNGLEDDTTLNSLAADLDGIDGLAADITVDGRLRLVSESDDLQFGFAEDSSGALAALGVNTFFTGDAAHNIGVHQLVVQDARLFAASQAGINLDTGNAEHLAAFMNQPLESRNGSSLAQVYDAWIGEVAQSASLSQAVADGFQAFHTTLEGEHLGLTGVSLDEEAVNMIMFQRTFQASARLITTISEMLDVLVNL
jgi:flagellar hook-associated protein 1 FlgK